MPDYYDVIKEPVALSTLKHKLLVKEYTDFAQFVRDCALISHNAQTYNRPESGAYQDAVVLRREFEKEFKALADQGVISHEVAIYPDLGELPPVESPPPPVEEEEEEEEEEDVDDDEDEEDDDDDSDDEGGKRRRKRGPRSVAAITKREGGAKDDGGQKGNDAESRKRRGRPPRVDTPMESRIKAVLKAIRKYKNDHGHIMIHQFQKLPDKVAMPEYYMEIKEPMAVEQIKVHTVDHPFLIHMISRLGPILKVRRESTSGRSTSPLTISCVTLMSCSTTPRVTTKTRARSTKTLCIFRCAVRCVMTCPRC